MHSPRQSTMLSFLGKWRQLHLVSIFFGSSASLLLRGGWVAVLGEPLPAAIPLSARCGHRVALECTVNSRKL